MSEQTTETDYTPEVVLHRIWGVASDVREDGFVNPSSVTYAPREASAVDKAARFGGYPVSQLVSDWIRIEVPCRCTGYGLCARCQIARRKEPRAFIDDESCEHIWTLRPESDTHECAFCGGER